MKKLWTLLATVLLVCLLGAAANADVMLPPGLTEIEDHTFEFDISLSGHLEIPYGTTRIGDYAFAYCTGLTSVTIPNTVTEIGDYAFYGCSGLTTLTLPDSVTAIGTGAFYACEGMTSLTLPPTLTFIGDGAFGNCTALSAEVYMIDTPDAQKIYWDCPQFAVFSFSTREDGSLCLDAYYGSNAQVSIPASAHGRKVTALGQYAFLYHEEIESVSMPNTLTQMDDYVFSYCTALTTVTIPASLTQVGEYAFLGCSSLTDVTLPDTLTAIGTYAFCECKALKSITFPESVKVIGSGAFLQCAALESVTFPQGECRVENSAFEGCKALKSLTLPANMVISNYAFYDTGWMWAQAQAVVDSVTTSSQTDFEKMLALHDWMTETNQYDQSLTYYSPDTMFLYHTGVCSGYARTFNCLLGLVDIEVQNIGGTGNGGSHEWNLVKLDGDWYHVDCTWDDPLVNGQDTEGYHDYCCVPDSVMQEDHTWDAEDYPAATGTKYFRGEKVE